MKGNNTKIDDILKSRFFKFALKKAYQLLGKKNKLFNLGFQALEKVNKGDSLQQVGSDFIKQASLLARLIQFAALGKYRQIAPKTMALIVGSVIYFVSPIDLIPDFIPMLGYADDVTLLAWIFSALGKEITDFEIYYNKYKLTSEVEFLELPDKES